MSTVESERDEAMATFRDSIFDGREELDAWA